MKNSKSIFRNIVKYLLLVIILIGGSFGAYSYFNSNTGSSESYTQIEKKENVKQEDKYIVDKAEKEYLENKFKELKSINSEVIGYMYVPGDGKDSLKEPMLQTTNNSKYLEYDLNNKPAPLLGAVFMDYENQPDLTKSDVKWVFGHARAGIEEKKITLDTRVFNNMNWFAKKDYFDSHRVIVMETPERKYYYEVTGVKVVNEFTNL